MGVSLSAGALLGKHLLGIWKDMGRRAQGTGGQTSLSVGALLGNL